MAGGNTIKPAVVKQIRGDIDKIVKRYGFNEVRRVFNRYSAMKRLQKTLIRTKKALEEELAAVTRRLGAR